MEELSEAGRSRRALITGLAAVGVGAPLLAACGSSPATGTEHAAKQPKQPKTGGSSQTPLVKTSEVPVGGGVILSQAVVTQPTAGEFKAFSPVCTHQGCTVAQIQNQQILCPCHGSAFSISTGAVVGGPPPTPRPPITTTTKNGEASPGRPTLPGVLATLDAWPIQRHTALRRGPFPRSRASIAFGTPKDA